MGGGGGGVVRSFRFAVIRVFEGVEKFLFSYVVIVEGEGARDDDDVVVATGRRRRRCRRRRRILPRPRLHRRFGRSDAPFCGGRRNVTHPRVAEVVRTTPGSLTQPRIVHHVRMRTHRPILSWGVFVFSLLGLVFSFFSKNSLR